MNGGRARDRSRSISAHCNSHGPSWGSVPPVTTPLGSVDLEILVSGGEMFPLRDTGSHNKVLVIVSPSIFGLLICAERLVNKGQSH